MSVGSRNIYYERLIILIVYIQHLLNFNDSKFVARTQEGFHASGDGSGAQAPAISVLDPSVFYNLILPLSANCHVSFLAFVVLAPHHGCSTQTPTTSNLPCIVHPSQFIPWSSTLIVLSITILFNLVVLLLMLTTPNIIFAGLSLSTT